MWVCVGIGRVCQHDKTKISDRNNLKLGTVVVLELRRSLLILGSKGGQGHKVNISKFK